KTESGAAATATRARAGATGAERLSVISKATRSGLYWSALTLGTRIPTRDMMRKREPNEKKRKPEPLARVVGALLKESHRAERVEQASVIPEWELLVGKQCASVTKPISVS